jgi:uncharacterized membrane protein
MKIKFANLVSLLIIIVSFGIALYFYPRMGETMVSHWGITGEPDGYMSKGWALFFFPILMIVFTVMFYLIPKIDPLKANVESFRKYFDGFIIVFEMFFLYIYILTIVFNLGYEFSMLTWLMPAFAGLFYYMGVMIGQAKRNYFIGIRTPWTLANDKVWDKTHRLGGILYKFSALIFLLTIFFPATGFFLFLTYIIGSSLWLMIYSYLEFRKESRV